jgi:hypothetical protein
MEAITTTSVSIGSPKEYKPVEDNLVEVKIKYPAAWDKEKFFADGDVRHVSPETAAIFAEAGILETSEEAPADEVKPPKKGK